MRTSRDGVCAVKQSMLSETPGSTRIEAGKGWDGVKRNHLVILVVFVALGLMAWAGVTNYKRRKQEQAKLKEIQSMLVQAAPGPSPSGESDPPFKNPLADKQAPAFTLRDTTGKKVS